MTYLTKKYKKADYSLVKLHEIQKKYDEKCTNDESLAKIFKSPTEQVDDMLQTEWPLNEKELIFNYNLEYHNFPYSTF